MKHMHWTLLITLGILLTFPLAGCGENDDEDADANNGDTQKNQNDTDSGQNQSNTVDTAACALFNQDVNACMSVECLDVVRACTSDTACVALDNCMITCNDDACSNSCKTSNAAGVSAWDSYYNCHVTECGACYPEFADNTAADCGQYSNDVPTCLIAECYDQTLACTENADCNALVKCNAGCSGATDCTDQCAVDYAGGFALLNVQYACLNTKCSACK